MAKILFDIDKIKQAREEINTDVRIDVKHFTNTDDVVDACLEILDNLLSDCQVKTEEYINKDDAIFEIKEAVYGNEEMEHTDKERAEAFNNGLDCCVDILNNLQSIVLLEQKQQ